MERVKSMMYSTDKDSKFAKDSTYKMKIMGCRRVMDSNMFVSVTKEGNHVEVTGFTSGVGGSALMLLALIKQFKTIADDSPTADTLIALGALKTALGNL